MADTNRPDEIQEWQWTWYPADTLYATDLLLVYLGYRSTLALSAEKFTITPKSTRVEPMRRALHRQAVGSALALIHPGRRKPPTGYGAYWFLYPGCSGDVKKRNDAKSRLATAGINADTMQVIDMYRWGLAWNQLTSGYRPTYSQPVQEHLVNSGADPIEIRPKTVIHRQLSAAGRRRLKKEAEEAEQKTRMLSMYPGQLGLDNEFRP